MQKFFSTPDFSFLASTVGVVNRFDFLRKVWLYTWLFHRKCSAQAGDSCGHAGCEGPGPACPDEMTALLKDVVAVLAGPVDPRLPAAVAQAVGAFDQDGVPVQHAAPKRHWISLAARTADAVDRYSRLAASLWLLCYFAVAITLLLLGSLSLTKLPLQK